jgi:hypothetical protein
MAKNRTHTTTGPAAAKSERFASPLLEKVFPDIIAHEMRKIKESAYNFYIGNTYQVRLTHITSKTHIEIMFSRDGLKLHGGGLFKDNITSFKGTLDA